MKLTVDTLANTDLASAWSAYTEEPEGVRIRVEFDAEDENPAEMQQEGWQAILDNFGRYVEGRG